ncbi:phosphoribosylformylglycinamidine synthase [Tissierella creatinini]|nr:phosphoribosylformylglycinamidine synthase [Tissierella creatinini]TJX61896.1 phosphoribosylformylglycinamidine synthase [Soehngenia saccharolytica]
MSSIRRAFVEKRLGFNVEAEHLFHEIKETLNIKGLERFRTLNRYDFNCESQEQYKEITSLILSEPNVDLVYEDKLTESYSRVLAMEYLPGQYDQRADSAEQCIQILGSNKDVKVKAARVYLMDGQISDSEYERIKNYLINPVDSREASMEIPSKLEDDLVEVSDIEIINGFINFDGNQLEDFRKQMSFAMSHDDITMIRDYFKEEDRDPTITELKVIDTYWSDHCRHTTFNTEIEDVKFQEGKYKNLIEKAFQDYLSSREFLNIKKPMSLMDLGTINAKLCKKLGLLDDLDISEEINACSIEIDVNIDDSKEKWLLMFKNETHNHPTEIEPFGGAATCLGGAIRDPLSGRSYVYQAMRVTGSGDPRTPLEETIPGKLPQRKITKEAARGYSSYGNQIGLATGQVTEIYHQGYIAKRMEVGAVIAAAPKENVIREVPSSGDIVLLLGGRTGRDGIGGATGSSKSHTEESLTKSGAEVQKGNAPEERKIQRLFRKPEVSKLIKRCNDFGAGGVSVAIGELAESLEIDLDVIPKKYEGLDGTELAISESQERMAVVIGAKDFEAFQAYSKEENLEVTKVADITDTGRLIMKWRGKTILDISREFLDTNGAKQYTKVNVLAPEEFKQAQVKSKSFKDNLLNTLQDLNVCSQQGLGEMFDATIGAATVLMPFGGKHRLTPPEGMVAKLPVLKGETNTCSMMSFGFDPEVSKWSPFHGGIYSVVESIAKIVAMGGDYKKSRLSMQEYFERLENDPSKWGKPFSALLGAYTAQKELGLGAIGGKDSMSGTFNDISVPPTIISFAVNHDITENIISPEFKNIGSDIYLIDIDLDQNQVPNFNSLKSNYDKVKELVDKKIILAAKTVTTGGIGAAISKMAFGNKIGFKLIHKMDLNEIFQKRIGSLLLEVSPENANELQGFKKIGTTIGEEIVSFGEESVALNEMIDNWEKPLLSIYPIKKDVEGELTTLKSTLTSRAYRGEKIGQPRVFIPAFPGTNSEYDSARAFQKAGALAKISVFRNQNESDVQESLKNFAEEIRRSQILMIPGGFSAGDEPDGSGKFIATVFRNPEIAEAVMDLIKNRDGLILGVCNGFQALIKLGLLPYGEIRPLKENDPTLTFNKMGRHISQLTSTKIVSKLSPWFNKTKLGDIYAIPLSHGEGRFVADDATLQDLIKNGQIATQYVDLRGQATYDGYYNPNGSFYAVEAITSPDGRILGKMGHSERIADDIYRNIPGEKNQMVFESGVEYFK